MQCRGIATGRMPFEKVAGVWEVRWISEVVAASVALGAVIYHVHRKEQGGLEWS